MSEEVQEDQTSGIQLDPKFVIASLEDQLGYERRQKTMFQALCNQQQEEIVDIRKSLEALVADRDGAPTHNGRVTKGKNKS